MEDRFKKYPEKSFNNRTLDKRIPDNKVLNSEPTRQQEPLEDKSARGIEAAPDSGKSYFDEQQGTYRTPDKRTMYKDWFTQAKNNAIERGYYSSSLISIDEIKGIKKPEITSKKQSKKTTKRKK